jgi:hypothetical protein
VAAHPADFSSRVACGARPGRCPSRVSAARPWESNRVRSVCRVRPRISRPGCGAVRLGASETDSVAGKRALPIPAGGLMPSTASAVRSYDRRLRHDSARRLSGLHALAASRSSRRSRLPVSPGVESWGSELTPPTGRGGVAAPRRASADSSAAAPVGRAASTQSGERWPSRRATSACGLECVLPVLASGACEHGAGLQDSSRSRQFAPATQRFQSHHQRSRAQPCGAGLSSWCRFQRRSAGEPVRPPCTACLTDARARLSSPGLRRQ